MKTKSLIYSIGALLLLFVLAACGGEDPTPIPAPTVAPPAVSTIVLPPAQPAASFCDTINPTWFSVNTAGLNYSWQANCVPATPYDQSQPPGPKGLPEHIEINFGVTNPADKQPHDPVIYIIPVAEYKAMWDAAGNTTVSEALDAQQAMLTSKPMPFSSVGILPVEEAVGALDVNVQQAYLPFGNWEGFRLVGRFGQSPNPVTNENLQYIFQGLAGPNDEYFVAMFWPVTTPFLSMDSASLPQAEMDAFNADMSAYMAEKNEMLNALSPQDWQPALSTLDSLLASIEYGEPQAQEPIPTVVVPTPEPNVPYGRITAPAGVNIRTGPGSNFPIIGTAAFGAEGVIIGRSADGAWWVTPIQGAPNNQGWVAASFVQAVGAENVPVIAAPPPPVPTATPTPPATPVPTISFWADQTTIEQGQCTTLRWDVNNIQAVWVYPQGSDFNQFPTTGQGSQQVCPTQTTTYEMRILLTDGSVQTRQVTIVVNQSNPLINSSWTLNSINGTQALVPGTSITLFLGSGSVMNGNGGCNNYNGSYSVGSTNIRFSGVSSTQMTCGAEIDSQEQMYLALLQSALSYQISGNQLVIFGGGAVEILRFTRTG
jgi:heat shock protein HslJ/uncharacterized protein YraI